MRHASGMVLVETGRPHERGIAGSDRQPRARRRWRNLLGRPSRRQLFQEVAVLAVVTWPFGAGVVIIRGRIDEIVLSCIRVHIAGTELHVVGTGKVALIAIASLALRRRADIVPARLN